MSGSISALAVTNERSWASVYVPGVAGVVIAGGVVACALCVVVLSVVVVDVDGAREVDGVVVVVVVVRSVVEAVRVAADDEALVLSSCTQPAVSASAAAAASHDNLDMRCSSVSRPQAKENYAHTSRMFPATAKEPHMIKVPAPR